MPIRVTHTLHTIFDCPPLIYPTVVTAPRNTNIAERRKRMASAKPTNISGQPEWVYHTPAAANNTETFAITSLREHNQTELMFMSSDRCRQSRKKHKLFAASASNPITPMASYAGT